MEGKVIVLGSGRLAHRLTKLFLERNIGVVEVGSKEFKEIEETAVQESSMDYARELLIKKGIMNASAVCIVDTEDAVNTYLLMAVLAARENVPVYATFFNENIVAPLALKHRNIRIVNPADIVSKLFIGSIPRSVSRDEEVRVSRTYNDSPKDNLVFKLLFGFVWLVLSGAVFFHFTESADWQKSIYLVITVITSVNFSDAELTNYTPFVQYLRMGLMLATYAYVIVTLAFIMDHIVKRRTDVLTLGRRRYHKRGHVIVCGLGRVGYAIVQDLLAKGEDVLVIESDPENKYLPALRANKISLLVGDAALSHFIIDAGIGRAKALVCAIDGDKDNLAIGLNARVENPNIRLLLRISDQSMAEEMKKRFNINYVFSKSYSTSKFICEQVCRSLPKTEKPRTERQSLSAS